MIPSVHYLDNCRKITRIISYPFLIPKIDRGGYLVDVKQIKPIINKTFFLTSNDGNRRSCFICQKNYFEYISRNRIEKLPIFLKIRLFLYLKGLYLFLGENLMFLIPKNSENG